MPSATNSFVFSSVLDYGEITESYTSEFPVITKYTNTTYSKTKNTPLPSELWQQHSGALWENGTHKNNCYAFIHEIDEFMRLRKIATYDDKLIDFLVDHFRGIGNKNSTINRKLSALYVITHP